MFPLGVNTYTQAAEVTQRLRLRIEQGKGQIVVLHKQIKDKRAEAETLEATAVMIHSAQVLLQQAAGVSRLQVKTIIEPLLTQALHLLIGGESRFELSFKEARGKWEVHFLTYNDKGIEGEGVEAFGGGLVDLESMLLRLTFLVRTGLPPVLVLDEPFRNIHGHEAIEIITTFLQRLSRDLGFQVVVITGDEDVSAEDADSILMVENTPDGSKVRYITNNG